jgi:hypothetical protein
MSEPPASPAVDFYAELAPRLADDEQRRLLRALLDRLAEGAGPAVKEEIRVRLRAVLGEGA